MMRPLFQAGRQARMAGKLSMVMTHPPIRHTRLVFDTAPTDPSYQSTRAEIGSYEPSLTDAALYTNDGNVSAVPNRQVAQAQCWVLAAERLQFDKQRVDPGNGTEHAIRHHRIGT